MQIDFSQHSEVNWVTKKSKAGATARARLKSCTWELCGEQRSGTPSFEAANC